MNPDYRSCQVVEDMWGGQTHHLVQCNDAEELTSPEDILRATYEWRPLVAQTEIRNSNTGLRCIIEYPVKTMNTRNDGHAYQIDTGPVAFPDLRQRTDRLYQSISLAFVAFNATHVADFVVETPTSVKAPKAADDVQVYHYSKRISLAATNRLYAVT